MKILNKDLKHGTIKINVDNVQDQWQLSNIVEIGDFVSGMTERKIKMGGVDDKAKISKRIVHLKIIVEKIEHDHQLRISGKIVEAPDDIPRGDYHTFDIDSGTTFTIEKENWTKYTLKKLDEAVNTQMTEVLIVAFDREEAIFAVLKRSGYEVLLHLKGDVQKKDYEEKKSNFYQEIYKQLLDYDQKYVFENIVIASPAFWKEYLVKEIKSDALKKKIVLATCSGVDDSSINEIIKRPELKTVLDKNKATSELKSIELLLGKINKNEAVYGLRDVDEKIASGNISILLVSEKLILRMRTEGKYQMIEDTMNNAETAGAELKIISSDEATKKLDGITGIAAILQWKEDYS